MPTIRLQACLALAAGALVGVTSCDLASSDEQVEDSRACESSDLGLREATEHFGLVTPPDASDVRYFSDVHPMFGDHTLELSFRTDVEGLDVFLEASDLPRPRRTERADRLPLPDACLGLAGLPGRWAAQAKRPQGSSVVLRVTMSRGGAVVYVLAADL